MARFRATCRIRSSFNIKALRLCVRVWGGCRGFPFARPLPSTFSATAGAPAALFEGSVLWTCPTSRFRSSLAFPLGSQRGPWHHPPGSVTGLPVPAQNACVRAMVLRPRRAQLPLAVTRQPVLSPHLTTTWTPESKCLHGSIALLVHPLSTLRPDPCGADRMTRGQRGSLLLSSYRTFTYYTLPVLTGAICLAPNIGRSTAATSAITADAADRGVGFRRSGARRDTGGGGSGPVAGTARPGTGSATGSR